MRTPFLFLFLFLLPLMSAIFTLSKASPFPPYIHKQTSMSVFFQDVAAGPNATLEAVAGIPGTKFDFLKFGTVFVTDDPITERIERYSPEVGRGQGLYVTSSLDGLSTHVSFSIVFTNREYKGSTLEIQGQSVQLDKVREYGVVSGTGEFRFAKGYVTFETVFSDPSIAYSAIRCNITVIH